MSNAFQDGFEKGFEQIVIIGTDLWDLESSDIDQAFKALEDQHSCNGSSNRRWLLPSRTFTINA